MKIKAILPLVFTTFIFSHLVYAEQGYGVDALPEAIKKQLPEQHGETSWSSGKLDESNNDNYVVLSFEDEEVSNGYASVNVYLFRIQEEGKVKLEFKSGKYSCSGHCSVEIKMNSIFLSRGLSDSWCSSVNVTYQYKKRENKFELIGKEDLLAECEGDGGDAKWLTVKNTSTNYLTNKAVITQRESVRVGEHKYKDTKFIEKQISIKPASRKYLEDGD